MSAEAGGGDSSPAGELSGTRPRVEIVGLGLIGSSLGLALRAAGYHVSGTDLDRSRTLRAKEVGALDEVGEDELAGLAFVATPASEVAGVARRLLARVGQGAPRPPLAVTDVAGVKAGIVAAVGHALFVGGHPMAGSEQVGPDGADAELFRGATWVLTPTAFTDEEAYARVRLVVRNLGADVVALEPAHHDELVAIVSHVPHLTAASLMVLAAEASESEAALLRLAAGGFRDMTRVAAGDPTIWPDVLEANADAVLHVLDALRMRLDDVRTLVERRDREAIVSLLGRAQEARRNLPARAPTPERVVEIRLAVPDRPGVLAEVTTLLGHLGINVRDLSIAHSSEGERGVLLLALDRDDASRAEDALAKSGYHPSLRRLA